MATTTKKARARTLARQRHQREQREIVTALAIGLGIGIGITLRTPAPVAPAAPVQAPAGGEKVNRWEPVKEPPEEPEVTVEAVQAALDRGDLVTAYPIWRRLMVKVRLPLDWFTTGRRSGEQVQ